MPYGLGLEPYTSNFIKMIISGTFAEEDRVGLTKGNIMTCMAAVEKGKARDRKEELRWQPFQ